MKKEDFEQQINMVVPCPDPDTTAALFAFGQELGNTPEYSGAQNLLNSLDFIARHFDQDVVQGAYEIIQCDSAALPEEMAAAAVFLQGGGTPEYVSRLALHGYLMCFYAPKAMGEISPLAVCTVRENGNALTRYTTHFGSFEPEAALRSAREYAKKRRISVADALLSLTVDMELNSNGGATKLLAHSDEAMTERLSACFNHCPALAARLTFDADREQVAVEYNPLWLELRQKQEPGQHGMALKP